MTVSTSPSRKLDNKGFAHHFLLLLFAVVFAIAGIGYLIASHADTCSSPGGGSCTTSPPATTFSCTLRGVPGSPDYGTVLAPKFTITNVGSQAGGISLHGTLGTKNSQGQITAIQSQTYSTGSLAPGQSVTRSFGITYTVPYSSSSAVSGYFAITQPLIAGRQSALTGGCPEADFKLPIQYAVTCNVKGVPTTVKNGQTFTPTLIIKNTGVTAFLPTYYYRVHLNAGIEPDYLVLQRLPNELDPGQKVSAGLGAYTLNNTASATAGILEMHVGGTTPDKKPILQMGSGCSVGFTIPS